MIQLKNITKIYGQRDNKVVALNDISLTLRSNEFVAVLGPSGCGKTTLLNLLGGLDKYTSGELLIDGRTTKNFRAKDWDSYRNKRIGFVFQNYNLIRHLSVYKNIEIALSLSGVSNKEKKNRTMAAIKEVGLLDKINKRPYELSGGQMQRVAIARAIVNNPDIVLADEPTGALDTKTSTQILHLLKRISKKRLVVMVTHNTQLAEKYSTRIVQLLDGKLVKDSEPLSKAELAASLQNIEVSANKNKTNTDSKTLNKKPKKIQKLKQPKTSMNFFTALGLSFKNLMTKKMRTILISFAGSIGIIGITIVLAISNGFNIYLDSFQRTTLMSLPISINTVAVYSDISKPLDSLSGNDNSGDGITVIPTEESSGSDLLNRNHINKVTPEYMEYLSNMNYTLFGDDTSRYASFTNRWFDYKLFMRNDAIDKEHATPNDIENVDVSQSWLIDNDEFLQKNLKVLAGRLPENYTEIVIITEADSTITQGLLSELGINLPEGEVITPEWILEQNIEIGLAFYEDVFKQDEHNPYIFRSDWFKRAIYYEKSLKLKVVGIVKSNPNDEIGTFRRSGIGYMNELSETYYNTNKTSTLGMAVREAVSLGKQYAVDDNWFPWSLDDYSYEKRLANATKFAGSDIPYSIYIYVPDFEAKKQVIKYLNDYNIGLDEADWILLTDEASAISAMIGQIIDIVSIVLIAFSSISLIVSSIMIGIITYISVIERTKEIGILRSLGARRKDIARIFLAESFIIGITAGVLGLGLSALLTIPINSILYSAVKIIPKIAIMAPIHILYMIGLSGLLTITAGSLPALLASKKDPVVALRSN